MILLRIASEAPRVGASAGFPPWGTLPRAQFRTGPGAGGTP